MRRNDFNQISLQNIATQKCSLLPSLPLRICSNLFLLNHTFDEKKFNGKNSLSKREQTLKCCVNETKEPTDRRRLYYYVLLIYSLVIWSHSSRQCSKNLCKIRARITSDIIFLWRQKYILQLLCA